MKKIPLKFILSLLCLAFLTASCTYLIVSKDYKQIEIRIGINIASPLMNFCLVVLREMVSLLSMIPSLLVLRKPKPGLKVLSP